jgi:hypothetical protein
MEIQKKDSKLFWLQTLDFPQLGEKKIWKNLASQILDCVAPLAMTKGASQRARRFGEFPARPRYGQICPTTALG